MVYTFTTQFVFSLINGIYEHEAKCLINRLLKALLKHNTFHTIGFQPFHVEMIPYTQLVPSLHEHIYNTGKCCDQYMDIHTIDGNVQAGVPLDVEDLYPHPSQRAQ